MSPPSAQLIQFMLSTGVAHVSWPHTTQDSLNHAEVGRLALGVAPEDMSIGAVAIDFLVAAGTDLELRCRHIWTPVGGLRCRVRFLCNHFNDGSSGCESRENESGEKKDVSSQQSESGPLDRPSHWSILAVYSNRRQVHRA